MNILVLTRAPGSACEYYRGVGVLSKIPGVRLRLEPEVGWTVLSPVDLGFAERPISPSDLEIIQMARDFGVPVWVDVDDDFFTVPAYNPARVTFGRKDVQERHAACLALANVVTVTTQHLKDQLSQFNDNIRIIPNAFNDYHWKWKFEPGAKDLVVWRGSATHRNDVRRYLLSMAKVQAESKAGWAFIGNDMWFAEERLHPEKSRFLAEMPTTHYWKALKDFSPRFWQVPLLDNPFNRAKSNIAWIEATYAGAVCLCPDLPEWNQPGAILYEAETEEGLAPPMFYPEESEVYETALASMLEMSDRDRVNALKASFEHISEHYMLSKVNEKRKEILEEICERSA